MRTKDPIYKQAHAVIFGYLPKIDYEPTPGLPRIATMDDVVNIICTVIGFPATDLKKRTRKLPIPLIRDFCFYFGYKYTSLSFLELSIYFVDDFRHTAAFLGRKVIQNLIDTNRNVRDLCFEIDQIFKDENYIEYKSKKAEKYRRTYAFQANCSN